MNNLTENFVGRFLSGDYPNEPFVQVFTIKEKSGKIIFAISDGKQSTHGIFADTLEQNYKQNKLSNFKEFSIVKLLKYRYSKMKNLDLCIVDECDVISHANGKIGNPIKAQSQSISVM